MCRSLCDCTTADSSKLQGSVTAFSSLKYIHVHILFWDSKIVTYFMDLAHYTRTREESHACSSFSESIFSESIFSECIAIFLLAHFISLHFLRETQVMSELILHLSSYKFISSSSISPKQYLSISCWYAIFLKVGNSGGHFRRKVPKSPLGFFFPKMFAS